MRLTVLSGGPAAEAANPARPAARHAAEDRCG